MSTQPVLFIDLHGVLVKTPVIFEEYKRLTVEHLIEDFQLEPLVAENRYDQALKRWETTAFNYLRNPTTKKVGDDFINFVENCDKLFPKFLYENIKINSHTDRIRTRPFEYAIASQVYALYPEVETTLQQLVDHGYEMYIASSSHSSHIKGIIEANSLDKYIVSYFGFDTVAATKHTLRYYKAMVSKVNANPQSCVMIGNSIHEVLKPRKIGMKTVHVNRERKVPPEIRRMANLSIENLSSLPEHLDSMILV